MFGLPSTTSLGLHRRTGQVSGRAGRDGVDGRLTGTRGTVSLLVGIFGIRVISGVFATYEGNTKLFSPQTTHSLVSHADTPRHGHGSLPRTEAAPTERTRHASGYGCSRAAQWLLYHRLPDPQLSPVAITPTTGWRIRTLCRKARWPPRSNERVSSVDEASAGGHWLRRDF